jgi:putative phosphoesterase
MRVLGIFGSPRVEGNSDILLRRFLEGAESKGAEIIPLFLREKSFAPCLEIYACLKDGECCLQDDMQQIYPLLRRSDVIALASPIFFCGVTAQVKAMIDRCQNFWVQKYLLQRSISPPGGRRKGIFLSVAGTRGERAFQGALLTVKYFFDCLEVDLTHCLLYPNIDYKGEILQHPDALAEAYDLGMRMATGGTGPECKNREETSPEPWETATPWLGLLSDSHDNLTLLSRAVAICNQDQVGLVLHGGDYVAPFSLAPLEELKAPFLGVFGNNDGEKAGLGNRSEGRLKPGPRTLQIRGRRILLVHDLEKECPKALKPDRTPWDLVVHGHTHLPEIRREGSTLFFNPGEVGGWLKGRASMGLLNLDTMEGRILDLTS